MNVTVVYKYWKCKRKQVEWSKSPNKLYYSYVCGHCVSCQPVSLHIFNNHMIVSLNWFYLNLFYKDLMSAGSKIWFVL